MFGAKISSSFLFPVELYLTLDGEIGLSKNMLFNDMSWKNCFVILKFLDNYISKDIIFPESDINVYKPKHIKSNKNVFVLEQV